MPSELQARWDPLGLMAVRQGIRERLVPLGPLDLPFFAAVVEGLDAALGSL